MFKVKNPMLGDVNVKIDDVAVSIKGGEEVLLEDNVGRKLQEMQPQLHCTYVEAKANKPKELGKVEKPKAEAKPKGKKDDKK